MRRKHNSSTEANQIKEIRGKTEKGYSRCSIIETSQIFSKQLEW
jgi:hypothetical protein